jgi:hypothetical protein
VKVLLPTTNFVVRCAQLWPISLAQRLRDFVQLLVDAAPERIRCGKNFSEDAINESWAKAKFALIGNSGMRRSSRLILSEIEFTNSRLWGESNEN